MRPSKEPDPSLWMVCKNHEDFPNKSIYLAYYRAKKSFPRVGRYPLWHALASLSPQWVTYRHKDGSDRWWLRRYKYGDMRDIVKDKTFFEVGMWYARYFEKSAGDKFFVYEEMSDG